MGKKNKHKKILKSEKAKVKLKAKKLPKNTNVTDTNFKIKKIVINKQLEINNENEFLTKRKLNLKDLITRLNHYNTSAKMDALAGIRELINNYSVEILTKNVNILLESIPKLTLDIEKSVRRESFRVLTMILKPLEDIKLIPFFDLLTSYLCCSMTHINQNIQEDSLLFMDVFLVTTPSLLAKHFMKIIPSFLDLISKIRTNSNVDRKLTVNLNSKQTSVKWRIKVLQRLQDLLKAVVTERQEKIEQVENISKIVKYNVEDNVNYFQFHNVNYLKTCFLSSFNKNITSAPVNSEGEILLNCINSIVPLLFETWLECKPNDNFEFESCINEETAEMLKSILEIFKLTWNLIQTYEKQYNDENLRNIFLLHFASDFYKHFIEKFPYVKIESSIEKRILTENPLNNMLGKCWEHNLLIVFLFIKYHSIGKQIKFKTKYEERIFDYLKECVNNWNKLNKESNILLITILKDIFSPDINIGSKVLLTSLLDSLIQSFNRNLIKDTSQDHVFEILCTILENEKLRRLKSYQLFLESLPEMLCYKRLSIPVLLMVTKLCRQNNQELIDGIRQNLRKIISNLEKIQLNMNIDDVNEYSETPYSILNQILYYANIELK